MTAAMYGATTLNHVEATELVKDANGQICGAKVRDMIPQGEDQASEITVRARGVINATGPFVDAIRGFDEPKARDIVVPSTGVHVVLPAHFCSPDMGLLDPNTSDGRVMFMLPWEGRTLVGTTDTSCKISPNPEAAESDIDWILKEIRGYLAPGISLQRADVLAAWSGTYILRPLTTYCELKLTSKRYPTTSPRSKSSQHRIARSQPPRHRLRLRPPHVRRR